MKNVLIISIIFLLSIPLGFAQDTQKVSRFKQDKKRIFKNDGVGKNDKGSSKGLPNPGGGGGGHPIPITGGVLLLAGGLFLYSTQQHKKSKTR